MVRGLQAVVVAAAIVMAFLVGAAVLDSLAESSGAAGGKDGNLTTSVGVEGGSQSFSSRPVDSVNVVKTSLNETVRFTGANDSNVTIDTDAEPGTDFSACTWGQLDSSVVSNNETGLLFASNSAIIWYNGTDDLWHGYYYNVSSRNSYRANVTATAPDTNYTLVCLNHAGTTLNMTANTTAGSAVTTTGSNIADYPDNISNWNGTVEETRVTQPLNGSQRTEWVNDPGLAVTGPAPYYRVTYDNFGGGPNYKVYFAAGDARSSNATTVEGFAAPDITAGTDYRISSATVSILAGSTILEQDGEVLYIAYTTEASKAFNSILSAFAGLGSMAALIPILLITIVIITRLRQA